MKMNLLIKAKEQQRKAAIHGRRTKLERSLNAIGLSLFASPFGSEAERKPFKQRTFPGKPLPDTEISHANQLAADGSYQVQGNEWEGWTVNKGQPEIFRLISQLATTINDIEISAHDPLMVEDRCKRAMLELTNLAKYCSRENSHER